jgi:hypothetical protein
MREPAGGWTAYKWFHIGLAYGITITIAFVLLFGARYL